MALAIGSIAPEINATASNGTRVLLSSYRDKRPVVLYFYPRDFTRVCTAETCGFRDLQVELGETVQVIGVSTDDDESHRKFSAEYNVSFPLLADTDKQIAKAYGAWGGLMQLVGAKRITYVIDQKGTISGVVEGAFSADKHIAGVRELLTKLGR
jgi:thioredoxin-dependent peroxiredoxin